MGILNKIVRMLGMENEVNTDYHAETGRRHNSLYGVRFDEEALPIKVDGFKTGRIDLTKELGKERHAIDLKKYTDSLDREIDKIKETTGIDLSIHRAKVACAMDKSGSMRDSYMNGAVQKTLMRLMPFALRFDDNGELDMWAFSEDAQRLTGITLNNYSTYVKKVMMKEYSEYGGTCYAPVLADVYKKYCKEERSNFPIFLMYLTDGCNGDRTQTDIAIRELAKQNVFIVFVGLGESGDFEYLSRLDDLENRECDNTAFFSVNEISSMSDSELYDKLLEQYPQWLKAKSNTR